VVLRRWHRGPRDASPLRGDQEAELRAKRYAGPRDDRFGLVWDVAVPCVTGLLAVLLFLQQRRAGAFLPRSRKSGRYEMISSI
jgi:hypothetical protein